MYTISEKPKVFHSLIKEIKMTFPEIIKTYATFVAYKEHCFIPLPKIVRIELEKGWK